ETEAALRRAAALGDGWYGVGHTPESAAVQATKLRALLAAAGRGAAPFELTVSHAGGVLEPDDVRRYAGAGIARVVVLPWQRGPGSMPCQGCGRKASGFMATRRA